MTTLEKTFDLDLPEGLSDVGRRAHAIVVAYLQEHGFADNGGCKAFYSPTEWVAREEKYGARSHLVVVYDGGAIRPVFSMDAAYDLDCAIYQETGTQRKPYSLYEGMQDKLREAGLYFEECTGYYSAIYGIGCTSSDDLDSTDTAAPNPESKSELFVVESIHEGSDLCVRRATTEESAAEHEKREGWAMLYDAAVALARTAAQRDRCRWFDFSSDPAPEGRD